MLGNGLIEAVKDYGNLSRVHSGKHISLQARSAPRGTRSEGHLALKVLIRSRAPEPKLPDLSPIRARLAGLHAP